MNHIKFNHIIDVTSKIPAEKYIHLLYNETFTDPKYHCFDDIKWEPKCKSYLTFKKWPQMTISNLIEMTIELIHVSARITNCGHSNIDDSVVCQNDMLLPYIYRENELSEESGCSAHGGLKVSIKSLNK